MSGFAQETISSGGGGGGSGDASAANQLTEISRLTSIDSKDFATSTKQDSAQTILDLIRVDTSNISSNADHIVSGINNIDLKTPNLGQALAANSVPIVLTALQLSTLTPPAAITGFATETTLSTLNGKVTACNTGAVTVSSSTLPTGASTSTKQDDAQTTLTSIESKLTTLISTDFATESTLTSKFAGSPTLFRNAGANATLNVKATHGVLISFSCYNTNASARFIQIWNSSTVAGSGTLAISKLVPAGSEVIIGQDYLSAAGLTLSNGIAFGFSTAKDTYSAGTAGEQSTEVLYI